MLALSTSYASTIVENGEGLVETMAAFEIDGIELEYRLSQPMLEQMRRPLKQSGLKVVGLHNYCPIPALTPPVNGGGDAFLLSALDREERQRALKWTMRTIEQANDLEAPVVILHCGRVEMFPEIDQLHRYYQNGQIDSEKAQKFRARKLDERDQRHAGHIDALLYALESLVRHAETQGVTLGLENRYHYHELPALDDFDVILAEFRGAPLGYWHDTGHAHANEVLGMIEPGSLLHRYADHLVGMHWHDARGLEDHLVPGSGEIDFNSLKPHLKPNLPVVIELKPGASNQEVQASIRFTRCYLF